MQDEKYYSDKQTCIIQGCYAQRLKITNKTETVIIQRKKYKEKCFRSEYHPSGLCYHHFKKALNLYEAKYPLTHYGSLWTQLNWFLDQPFQREMLSFYKLVKPVISDITESYV